MITEITGIYAILNNPPLNTFKEWRYLVAGTECDDAILILPQTVIPKPVFDIKTQKLVELITVRVSDVLQSWEVQNLSLQQIEDRKQPDFIGFQRAMFNVNNVALFAIYSKIVTASSVNPFVNTWYGQVQSALNPALYTKEGFSTAIQQLSLAIPLLASEIATVNIYLYQFDLELIK